MEYWFVIILALIAVIAIGSLIYFELMGEDAALIMKKKHKRGKYINDQTAVIYQTIKDTIDSNKAYLLFVEYLFANSRQFLEYVRDTLTKVSNSYHAGDIKGLEECITDCKEMKIELKDQLVAQRECLSTIERPIFIESASWIHLANNCRFSINASVRRMAEVCIEYPSNYSENFPEVYNDQLEFLLCDICNICNTFLSLVGTNDITGMRELRKRMSIILDESYTHTTRLYELIHDGRSEFSEEQQIALKYALNAFQELHDIIYTLRRLVLATLCLTLSLSESTLWQNQNN